MFTYFVGLKLNIRVKSNVLFKILWTITIYIDILVCSKRSNIRFFILLNRAACKGVIKLQIVQGVERITWITFIVFFFQFLNIIRTNIRIKSIKEIETVFLKNYLLANNALKFFVNVVGFVIIKKEITIIYTKFVPTISASQNNHAINHHSQSLNLVTRHA